ncbi:MAG: hypothetical protein ACFE8F_06695 [Promethearchaeota archaeon]
MMLGVLLLPRIVTSQLPNNPREGWAVLLEMDDYPGTNSDLPTGFSDVQKWISTLLVLGWQTHHIQIYQDSLTQSVGEAALHFLAQNADANDVVLFYIFAHGNWILNEMHWENWFSSGWLNLASQEKVLVVSACGSEAMINPVRTDSAGHVHLASSQVGEYSWAGLPEEGLPIIGDVFNHFLTNAFQNASADADDDGEVVVEEAFAFATPLTREYISSVVFPAFPYYAVMSNHTAPIPVIDDAYPEDMSLQVEPGGPPVGYWLVLPPELLLILSVVMYCVIIILIGLFIRRRR